MDRDRLQEVRQTDLTESRVNEDFVDWLKNKGPTWLLVILVALCAYLGLVRWRQGKARHVSEAWAALAAADLPGSFEDVANEYDDVGQLPAVARVRAADTLMGSVQKGLRVGAAPPPLPGQEGPVRDPAQDRLTPEERQTYLDRAGRLYQAVLDGDDDSLAYTLYAVSAMNGMAAIAESTGDPAGAQTWYDRAAERAASHYPGLADVARARSGRPFATGVALPTAAELVAVRGTPPPRLPVDIDDALRDLILPEEEGADAGGEGP